MSMSISDIYSTVDQIIATERGSLNSRIKKNDARTEQLTDLSTLKGKVSTVRAKLLALQKNATFQTKKATSSDASIVTASCKTGATNALFNVKVTKLAEAARAQSTATLFGATKEGTSTTLTSAEVNTNLDQNLDANQNVISGNPNFGSGGNLTTGHFIINETTFLVTNNDTVNTLLTKINNSSAGVTAHYDEASDKVIIESDEVGDTETIELGEDTTGFFSKLKLAEEEGGVTQTGVNADLYRNISETALAGSITNGYLTINNCTVAVDPENDSLYDVITRVNSSSAGVSMFYDEDSDRVTLTADEEGVDLNLEDENSGFFKAIKLMAVGETKHTYEGTNGEVVVNGTTFTPEGNKLSINGTTLNFLTLGETSVKVETDTDKFVTAVQSLVDSYNDATSSVKTIIDKGDSNSSFVYRMQTEMRTMLQGSISNSGTYQYFAEIGLTFTRGITSGTMEFNQTAFLEALNAEPESVENLFSYDSDNDGLRDDGGIANTLAKSIYEYSKGTTGAFDERRQVIEDQKNSMAMRIADEEEYFEARRNLLIDSMLTQQAILQKLEAQYTNASSISTNFNLINGSLIS